MHTHLIILHQNEVKKSLCRQPLCVIVVWYISYSNGQHIAGFHVISLFSKIRNYQNPSKDLLSSDVRQSDTLMSQQGSSLCNRPQMNFQVYVLCDIKMATQKGSQVARSKDELSLKFLTSCSTRSINFKVSELLRVITFRFNSKTQRQMFLLLYGRHICPSERYSQKNLVRVCSPFTKTLTLFVTKICDIFYLISDLTKHLKPYL